MVAEKEAEIESLKGRLKAANAHINRVRRERDGAKGEKGEDKNTLMQRNEELEAQVAEMEEKAGVGERPPPSPAFWSWDRRPVRPRICVARRVGLQIASPRRRTRQTWRREHTGAGLAPQA